jgi:hypothetical protein
MEASAMQSILDSQSLQTTQLPDEEHSQHQEAAPAGRRMSADKAIKVLKNLIALRLQVEQMIAQTQPVLAGVERLFSAGTIDRTEAEALSQNLESLSELAELQQKYALAAEKALPAMKLVRELGLIPQLPTSDHPPESV